MREGRSLATLSARQLVRVVPRRMDRRRARDGAALMSSSSVPRVAPKREVHCCAKIVAEDPVAGSSVAPLEQ
jgi:hypothetical protein